jgi:hypothetical protein
MATASPVRAREIADLRRSLSGMPFAKGCLVHRTIDGQACVTALQRAGFIVQHQGHGLTLLRRGARIVLVPAVGVFSAPMLDAILRSAGLTASELEEHLPRLPKRSGTYPRRDLDGAPPSSPSSIGRRDG